MLGLRLKDQSFSLSPLADSHPFLAIAAFPTAIAALQAYQLLQYYGISMEHLAIVGEGYTNPGQVGLRPPSRLAWQQAHSVAQSGAVVGAAVGFGLGFVYRWGSLATVHWALPLWMVILWGMVGGGLGAVCGAIAGLWVGRATVQRCWHHLGQEHYLLMIEGPYPLVRRGRALLRSFGVLALC